MRFMRFKNVLHLMLVMLILQVSTYTQAQPKKIVCLSGAITETVRALGMGKNIVAVDVTSVWPKEVEQLPKVSRNRSVSAEGITSFRPDLVLSPEGDLSREVLSQLRSVGINVIQIRQDYSVAGASAFIKKIAGILGRKEIGEALAKKTEVAIQTALRQRKTGKSPKVLFVYARGSGIMSVSGKGSHIDAIIQLAGGKNAIQDFSDFKPYTTEALVKANPDVILMFDFGLSSLGGKDAVLRMPGVSYTNAGKNKKIIEMDGPLLINFSTRLPEAIKELNARIF
jgi:iron complex transport system substrate-binding protein